MFSQQGSSAHRGVWRLLYPNWSVSSSPPTTWPKRPTAAGKPVESWLKMMYDWNLK